MRRTAQVLVLLVLLAPLAVSAAETTGRISGKVRDAEGKPLAGVLVTVRSSKHGGVRAYATNRNGRYTAALLPPGPYTVDVSVPDGVPQASNVYVRAGLDVPLDVVIGDGSMHTNAGAVGSTTGGERFSYATLVDNLPIVHRDPERVAELAPNVSFGPTPNTLAISGAPSFDTSVVLDGVEVSDPYSGSAPQLWVEDGLDDLQVMTTGIGARYGRFQGGVIQAVTKSGGNGFDGSARIELTKDSWGTATAVGETLSEDLTKTYSATVSGPIVQDRLWYFLAGRTIPTSSTTKQTALSGETFPSARTEDRWQGSLTYAIDANHRVEANYARYDASMSGRTLLPAADLRAATGVREDARNTASLEYQGILGDTLFVNARASRKRVSIAMGAPDPSLGSPFFDFFGAGFQIWNNAWWDAHDPSVRDADAASVELIQLLSAGSWGDHTIEYGVQVVDSTTAGENRQSPTGYNLLNYDVIVTGAEFSNVTSPSYDPMDPRFNLISYANSGFTYRWQALPLGGDQQLKNTAVYVQDSWQLENLRVDAGLRYERYEGTGPRRTFALDFNEVSPRVALTYNIGRNWQLQANWGKYVSRFNDQVGNFISGVGGAPYVRSFYTGPDASDLTYEQVDAIILDDANWGIVAEVHDPAQPTRFLAPDATAPYAKDINLALEGALPGSTGVFTLTYTDRAYTNLLDDFVGPFVPTTVTDPNGGPATFTLDTTVWDNASVARRDYNALAATVDWRPTAAWTIGGNWTYAETKGNYEGETRDHPSSGSDIGNYDRSRGQAIPYGYLDADIRNRVHAWVSYGFDLGRGGNLTLGSIATYQSGTAYSLQTSRSYMPDPLGVYLDNRGTYTWYFGGRGTERFGGWWKLDLSLRYQVQLRKSVDAYVKLDVTNLTDEDTLVTFNTSGRGVTNTMTGDFEFLPSVNFGRARSPTDYQQPRRLYVSAGVQW